MCHVNRRKSLPIQKHFFNGQLFNAVPSTRSFHILQEIDYYYYLIKIDLIICYFFKFILTGRGLQEPAKREEAFLFLLLFLKYSFR